MSLLESHIEQISLSANAISELVFPPPQIFTNALLNAPDITALIRDTEAHERALFSVNPASKAFPSSQRRATRRGTTFPTGDATAESMASRIYSARNNRNQSAVARVLGTDMMDEIKRSTGSATGTNRGEINVEVLLRGAEILCDVYPVAGATEKISTLRYRYREITESIGQLEARVAENAAELERMRSSYDQENDDYQIPAAPEPAATQITDEDIARELEEIRELERKKRDLEDRVTGMERDLGGLLR